MNQFSILPRSSLIFDRWKVKTRKLVKFARFAVFRLEQDRLHQVASTLTLTTLLSMVPLLALMLAIFTAFPQFKALQISLEKFLENSLIPNDIAMGIIAQLTQFVNNATGLKAIGGGLFVLFSVSIIYQVEISLNEIWRVRQSRSWVHRLLVYWGVLTLGPLMLGLSIWTSSTLSTTFFQSMTWLPGSFPILTNLFSLVISTLLFSTVFVVVPNCYVAWRDALVGGSVTAIFLELFGAAFGFYMSHVSTLHLVYGTFATIPIFLIWLRSSWLVILLGATVTASMPYVRLGRWEVGSLPGKHFVDSINILITLNRQRATPESGLNTFNLSNELRLNTDELLALLEFLLQEGWVVRVGEGQREVWVMVNDPKTIKIERLMQKWLLDRRIEGLDGNPALLTIIADTINHPDTVNLQSLLDSNYSHSAVPNYPRR